MSMFLPEEPQQAQPGSVTVGTPADPETTSEDVALMQRVFAAAARNPNLIPDQFLAYVLDWLNTQRLTIPIGQVFGFRQQQDVRGRVDSTGAIVSGTGFTVTKLATGDYKVTFDDALPSVPSINAAVDSNAGTSLNLVVANGTTTDFQVNIFTSTTGVKTDAGFYFTASPFV